MAGYWTETRPNGKPIEPGTVCWVTEPLDGGHEIFTYGKDQQEVIEKLSRTNAHAQAALAKRSTPATAPPPASAPVRLTGDEVMQATQDLQNPAKAGAAVAKLVQDATGVDLQRLALNNFASLAQEWQEETTDFYEHPGNMHLLVQRAKALAGGNIASVTKQHLSQAFDILSREGLLFEAPAAAEPTDPPTPSPVPAETQVQRTERPRGHRFATSTRSTTFRAAQQQPGAQNRTPKYTAEEINSMPASKARQLIEADDPDYAAACEYHFGAQATA